jgi:hypothetical protein
MSSVPPAPPASEDRSFAPISLGWLVVVATDAVVLATRMRGVRLGDRLLAHAFAAAQLLVLGAAMAIGFAVWSQLAARTRLAGRARWIPYAALFIASCLLGALVLREDVSGLADSFAKTTPLRRQPIWMVILVGAASATWPIAVAVARGLARTRAWPLGVAAAVVVTAANGMDHDYPDIHLIVTPSYPGLHLLLAVVAASLAAASLPASPRLARWIASASPPRVRAAQAALAVVAAGGLVLWPSNRVTLILERHLGAVLLAYLGPLHTTDIERDGTRPQSGAFEGWLVDRAQAPDVPATLPRLVPDDAIVLVVSIDSMRGELLEKEEMRAQLPVLFKLRDRSVYFRSARAPGSSTAPSLAAVFAGKSYSSLYWTRAETNDSLVFPVLDESKRFPALLADAGVGTTNYEGTGFLLGKLGLVRGFTTEKSLRKGGFPKAGTLLAPVEKALADHPEGPQLYFTHLLDAHSPYSGAGPKATPFEGYLAELGTVDARLKKLFDLVERDEALRRRTTIVVMSDHGEAFGEHGMLRHGVSLYDELLRVPFFIRVPGVAPRVVDEPVTLLDLGPTILDLFGRPTPRSYMGQSLTGYLRGESPKLDRPIVAEGRLERALVFPDGVKVIHDSRTHSIEIYDLAKDPGELVNLYDEADPAMVERARVLLRYFAVHTLARPGYTVPYRKW